LNGEQAEAACEVACTACGRCAVDAAPGLIQIINNLAVIDYSRNHQATRTPIERCPTGAIVWIDEERGATKGVDAKTITRKSPLPIQETELPVPVGVPFTDVRGSVTSPSYRAATVRERFRGESTTSELRHT